MKPAEIILAYRAQLAAEIDERKVKLDLLDVFSNTFSAMAFGVGVIAERCQQTGKIALLGTLPPEIAEAFQQSLDATQPYWTTLSPYPFPQMPDQPTPPIEPE